MYSDFQMNVDNIGPDHPECAFWDQTSVHFGSILILIACDLIT